MARRRSGGSVFRRRPAISLRIFTLPPRFPKPSVLCSRTKTSACTAVCAPSAAPRRPGTCRSSNSKFHMQEGPYLPQSLLDQDVTRSARPDIRVNDFAFKLANGTGSASANGLLMQAIFRMGIPVSGKNLFPSNIQGLPTWYEIRVNARGHTARTAEYDVMVAMNA